MNDDKKTLEQKQCELKESIQIRGICAVVERMSFPKIDNLNEMLLPLGYRIEKIEQPSNTGI